MTRFRFPLTSDQLELLLAFEQAQGLGRLAEIRGRDPSVISRNLQRIAEDFPVLIKSGGRWELTPLGRQVNISTREFLENQERILQGRESNPRQEPCFSKRALLVILNAQKGLLDPSLGGRSNEDAEKKIGILLESWRREGKPVLHVRHVSENPRSVFHRGAAGCEFLPALAPAASEAVITKDKASAFNGTDLEARLRNQGLDTLILTGFTANECIDATAKDAADRGFTVYVVGDATAMFDLTDPDGKLIQADRVHRLTMANLHSLCAKVVATDFLL